MSRRCVESDIGVARKMVVFFVMAVSPCVLLEMKENTEADQPVSRVLFMQGFGKKSVAAGEYTGGVHPAVFVECVPHPLFGNARLWAVMGVRRVGIVHSLINCRDQQRFLIREPDRPAHH